ncbi:MAG: hypothetical protein QCI82_03110 [Candidatus Thermoplasmatota archaeon]|nr:hypothetical protein [Candidatus Thermoplasmatota archaeon]
MITEYQLEEALLNGFEYPVALVVEVTKQGIVLSKMRYLKAVGDVVNETVRCPSMVMYCHMGKFIDPHLIGQRTGPMGIDLLYLMELNKGLFNESVDAIRRGRSMVNTNNPSTKNIASALLEKINTRDRINFNRLTAQEQGLILEPYVHYLLKRAGSGKRKLFQNVELVERGGLIKCRSGDEIIRFRPTPAPMMELDILLVTNMNTMSSILKDLEMMGFKKETLQF